MSEIDRKQWIAEQVAAVPLLVHRDRRARGLCIHLHVHLEELDEIACPLALSRQEYWTSRVQHS